MIINSYNLIDRDLCVICPTRQRPEKLQRMYESFTKTKCGKTAIVLCVDVDDQTEYNYTCAISVEPHKTNTEIINDIFKKYPNFKYYMVINDDIIFNTFSWDVALMKNGINFPEDGTKRQFPTFSVIDGDIPRTLGWLQMPTLEYLYGDTVWQHIGKCCGVLNYHPEVIIEHPHGAFGEGADNIYNKTNSEEQYDNDRRSFRDWLVTKSNNDVQKVMRLYDRTPI